MSQLHSLRTNAVLKQIPIPVASDPDVSALPHFLQKIPAGFPSPAADYTESTLDLNEYLVNHKAASFYFTVVGFSMTGAFIDDGDKVLVDRSIEPKHGHIVIASVNDEYTIKRLYMRKGVIELRPENPAFQPIRMREGEELQIWGVVVGVIRKIRA